MAKQFITIPEFALLFNCSRGHVDKLLDQAQQPNCKYPLPYVDLNGLIQFDRLEVLEWARLRKPFDRKRRKTGGKKKAYPVAVNQEKKVAAPRF
jgi:predicted DNA-binding transcriptional regulator AlpA